MLGKSKAVLQKIDNELLSSNKLKLYIKREDLINPSVSGNKWRKLKYNLLEARNQSCDTILTFGGAYSNHIYATAAAAHQLGMKSIGIIRGEVQEPLNQTLSFASEQGMQLNFISREEYRRKNESAFLDKLTKQFGKCYVIPEGGSNLLAIKGCEEIIEEIEIEYDYLCTSVGTGGTIAGLINGSKGVGRVIGFSALKGDFLTNEVKKLLIVAGSKFTNWHINTDYHFGGYAKIKPELIQFIREFKLLHNIPLDPIYTGKMLYGIYDLIKKGFFKPGNTIIALHTGGLQGIDGINERYGVSL